MWRKTKKNWAHWDAAQPVTIIKILMISKPVIHTILACLILLTIFAAYTYSNPELSIIPDSQPLKRINCPENYPEFLETGSENEKLSDNSKLVGLKILIRHGHRKAMKIKKLDNDEICDIKNSTTLLAYKYQVGIVYLSLWIWMSINSDQDVKNHKCWKLVYFLSSFFDFCWRT